MEHVWENAFDMPINWSSVYSYQVWNIKEKKLAEFNYKILCNILYTKSTIAKWNKDISTTCDYCNEEHTARHLIFECPRVVNLWKLIGSVIKLDIKYKHVVIGNTVTNNIISMRNLLISYIAYGIYKFWVMSENKKVNFMTDSLQNFVKKDLFKRSLYLKEPEFSKLVDNVITEL